MAEGARGSRGDVNEQVEALYVRWLARAELLRRHGGESVACIWELAAVELRDALEGRRTGVEEETGSKASER